jgi:hypothetical protein
MRTRLAVLVPVLLSATFSAGPIVTRPGVPDSSYVVPDDAFPPLADLPFEGHGVLIAPDWVVSVAHATSMMQEMPEHRFVTIAGRRRKVAEIVFYPGALAESNELREMWNRLLKEGMSGDAAPAMAKSAAVHDLALLRLSEPVTGVTPAPLYRGSGETTHVVELYGKGATGNGRTGVPDGAPHRGKLRRAYNRITAANEQWLLYRFDCGADALPLEGASGSGDSGGPVLMEQGGRLTLVGLTAQGRWQGDLSQYKPGLCGADFAASRISYYAGWIDSVMAAHSDSDPPP